MLKSLLPALVLAFLSAPSYADNCDDLRGQIDAKIKAAGVASYSVVVVDTAASAPGKVVGTCARGAKKIMYTQLASAPQAAAATTSTNKAKQAAPAAPDNILTECKDGTVSKGGNCKK